MRILLAEDERELATWLVRALAQSGFQVDWVDDGRMVRRSLKATVYDALILGARAAGTVWRGSRQCACAGSGRHKRAASRSS